MCLPCGVYLFRSRLAVATPTWPSRIASLSRNWVGVEVPGMHPYHVRRCIVQPRMAWLVCATAEDGYDWDDGMIGMVGWWDDGMMG